MEPRLVLRLIATEGVSRRTEEVQCYDSKRGSHRQLHYGSQKQLRNETSDEKSIGRVPEIEREFRKFKQKLTINPKADENVEILQPRTSNNRSRNELGKIYSKQKQSGSHREGPREGAERLLVLKDREVAKLKEEIAELNDKVRELQQQNSRLNQNLDVLQKTIHFGYGQLQSKNGLLHNLTEAMQMCGISSRSEHSNFKESMQQFVECYRERDRFFVLCQQMVQSVLPQAKHEKLSIKKCWKLLKGIVEEFQQLTIRSAELNTLLTQQGCRSFSDLVSLLAVRSERMNCEETQPIRLEKQSANERPADSAKTRKAFRNQVGN